MTDYISREALLERIDDIWDCADMVFEPNDNCCRADDCASCKWVETKNAIRKIAANFPAADVREVRRGKWIQTTQPCGWRDEECAECSVCGEDFVLDEWAMDDFTNLMNFCPNCGADMREEQT